MPDNSDSVVARWQTSRAIYVRDHVVMAVLGALGATLALRLVGNPDYWVGAVAALLAIGVRGTYLASEDLALTWVLTADTITGSNGRTIALSDISAIRRIGSAVQIISRNGDKFLMKYLDDTGEIRRLIEAELSDSKT